MPKALIKENHPTFLLFFLLYSLGNWPLLLNNGVFWDDWSLYNMDFSSLMLQFESNGLIFFGYFHYYLQQLPYPALVYHIITFGAQIFSIWCIWQIIIRSKVSKTFLWLVLLAGLIPFYEAKNTMICLPYTLCYLLFWTACLFLQRWLTHKILLFRILALIFFFLSFITNSLLFFYILPVFFLYLHLINKPVTTLKIEVREVFSLSNLRRLFSVADFCLLPIVYFAIQKVFFSPTSYHSAIGYNQIKVEGFLRSPLSLLESIKENALGLTTEVYAQIFSDNLSVILFFTLSVLLIWLVRKTEIKAFSTPSFRLLIAGLALFALASFPYALVGKPGSFWGYETRHQLLLSLGVGCIIFSLTSSLVSKYRNLAFGIILASFITSTFAQNLQYVKSWLKQESLVIQLSESDEMTKGNTFVYIDMAKELNANEHSPSFYNLNGLYKLGTGKENVLISDYHLFEHHRKTNGWKLRMPLAKMFNMSDYVLSDTPDFLLKIENGDIPLGKKNIAKALFYFLTDKKKFKELVKNITSIKLHPFQKTESEIYLNDKHF